VSYIKTYRAYLKLTQKEKNVRIKFIQTEFLIKQQCRFDCCYESNGGLWTLNWWRTETKF